MNSEITIRTRNGDRCHRECHKFRLGADSTGATAFEASHDVFPERLVDALVNHVRAGRAGPPTAGLFLQVWCGPAAQWCNVQNPWTVGVMAITHEITGKRETANELFAWACNTAQLWRDMDALASGLTRLGVK